MTQELKNTPEQRRLLRNYCEYDSNYEAPAWWVLELLDDIDTLLLELLLARPSDSGLYEALKQEHDALGEMAVHYGAYHEGDCPQDDTCDCKWKSFNERVNKSYKLGAAALSHYEAAQAKEGREG